VLSSSVLPREAVVPVAGYRFGQALMVKRTLRCGWETVVGPLAVLKALEIGLVKASGLEAMLAGVGNA
jgi:hypothetical protein